jgi:hypothetical protein
MYILITFDSTHHALSAESVLLQAKLQPDIQPTPRELSASCGLAIALSSSVKGQAIDLLQTNGVCYRAVYRVTIIDEKQQRVYQEEEM